MKTSKVLDFLPDPANLYTFKIIKCITKDKLEVYHEQTDEVYVIHLPSDFKDRGIRVGDTVNATHQWYGLHDEYIRFVYVTHFKEK